MREMRSVIGLALFLLVGSFFLAVGFADDWPTWRGPRLDGISAETGWIAEWPEEGPKIAWRKEIGVGYSAVVVEGDRVYAMGFEDEPGGDSAELVEGGDKKKEYLGFETVFCLNAEDGRELWKFRYPAKTNKNLNAGGPASTPTVYDGRLYTLSRDGQFHCIDAIRGKVIWRNTIEQLTGQGLEGWWASSSGVIHGQQIVYQHGGSVVINRGTGELVNKSPHHPVGYSTPTLFQSGKKTRAAIFHSAGLALVDVGSGVELDNYPWEAKYDIHAATPIVTDRGRQLFASSGYGNGCILFDVSGGKLQPIWGTSDAPNESMGNFMSGCVLNDGYLYGFDKHKLTCIEIETGEQMWSHQSRQLNQRGALMMADNKLIVIDGQGTLAIVEANPEEFKMISSVKVLDKECWTMPTLANGRIYCRNDQGVLVCIDVRPGQ